jgi:4-amino-4-deoxy-L-arabinose transferase-like glycosyltransferase
MSPSVGLPTDETGDSPALTHETDPSETSRRGAVGRADSRFWLGLTSAVAIGGAIRFAYLFHGAPMLVRSDGFTYHHEALRVADGLGYTSPIGDVGAEMAHHPPGWVTVLAGVAELGGRSMWAHQVTGLVIGLGVILVAGLVGRRYAGARVGVIAAFVAAAYPGFWVIDVQILSEPLGLLIVGLFMLVLADLWTRPSLAYATLTGATLGALTLARAEQLALLVIVVVPVLVRNRRVRVKRRIACIGLAVLAAAVPLAPWVIYNLGRFEAPVLISTNVGPTLLAGNCASTYRGALMGSYDNLCNTALYIQTPELDRSQQDIEARKTAIDNMSANLQRLPSTVLTRYGRLLGVFRPAQTVDISATSMGSATWPVWAWVTSFWVLAPLAAYGSVLMGRSRRFQWPLVAPAVIVVLVVTVAFGDPRYHTMADLGIVVLAAVALNELARRRTPSRPAWPYARSR